MQRIPEGRAMGQGQLRSLLRQLRRVMDPQAAGGLSDAQVLERFVRARDETAFEVLVWRHGPMVLSVCRRVLRCAHDAEDAFQATFLTLVRKAASIGHGQALAAWLHRVAYRIALDARARTTRRTAREKKVAPTPTVPEADTAWQELRPLLDEEVDRLPEKYRLPVVLCYLEGKTNAEAAQQLGCARGTIAVRLMRARERLRERLARRGITVGAGLLGAMLANEAASAAIPLSTVSSTMKAALAASAGHTAAIAPQIAALTEGALHAMTTSKLKSAALVLLTLGLVGTGASLTGFEASAGGQVEVAQRPEAPSPGHARGSPLKVETSDDAALAFHEEPQTAARVVRALAGHAGGVAALAFTPDGRALVSGGQDNAVRVWDVESGRELRVFEGFAGFVQSLAISPDGQMLAVSGPDDQVRLWELFSGKRIHSAQVSAKEFRAIAFTPDGRAVAIAGEAKDRMGEVFILEVASGRLMIHIQSHPSRVLDLAYSPDGKLLVSASADRTVKLWDATTGRQSATLRGHEAAVTSAAFTPDGKVLATGSADRNVQLWDVATGKEITALRGHADVIYSLAISPDGRLLATASKDGTVKLWVTADGRLVLTLPGQDKPVLSVTFSPDGKLLATAGGDGQVRLWTVPTAGQIASKTAAVNPASGDRLDELCVTLAKSNRTNDQVVEALYLATLARLPADGERRYAVNHIAKQKDRQEGCADLLWALVNSKEFSINLEGLQKRDPRQMFKK